MRAQAAAEGRVVFAFFAMPLVSAVVAFALFPILEVATRSHGRLPRDVFAAAVSIGAGAGLVAVFVTVFAAVPLFVWGQKRARVSRKNTLASGAILGNLPSLLILTSLIVASLVAGEWPARGFTYGIIGALRAAALGTVVGTTAAAAFWWIAGLQPKSK